MDTLNTLSTIYRDWLRRANLPQMSMDELLSETLTDHNRTVLVQFHALWEHLEDQQRGIK